MPPRGETGAPRQLSSGTQRALRGPVLSPEGPGYDVARTTFNAMTERRPAAIACCAGSDDVEHVVAYDGCDFQPKPEFIRDCQDLARRGPRIGGAHVGDDPRAVAGRHRQHRPHPFFKKRIVTTVRIELAGTLGQRDGALAEAFEHQVVEFARSGEFHRGFDPVPRIAAARPEPDAAHALVPSRRPDRCPAGENSHRPIYKYNEFNRL